ncbi:MAG: HAD family phosphatase [Paracoccaceae bacterium]
MPLKYAAVIFDLDGLLIDTESTSVEIGISTLAEFGHEVERDFMLSMIGVDEVECAGIMRAHLGEELDFQAFDTRWRELCRARHAEGIAQKSGAEDLLRGLAAAAIPRAVATNSRSEAGRRKLGQSGLHRHFAHVVGFDLVTAPKPAPDVYLMAAELLGVDPADCLAFEDSDPGVAAALAAGMRVVQVPDLIPSRTNRAHFNAESLTHGAHLAGIFPT